MTDAARSGDEIQLVTFRVGGHAFAFSVFEVERVLRFESPTPLPRTPDFLEGMLSYDGDLVPVIDLRRRLEAPHAVGADTRTMIVEWEQGRIGVVVDAVLELLKVPVERVRPPPPIVVGLAGEFVSGIVASNGGPVVILAVSRLLSSKERMVLEALNADTTP